MNNLECQLVYEGKSERVNFKTNDPNPSLYVFAKKVFKDIPSDGDMLFTEMADIYRNGWHLPKWLAFTEMAGIYRNGCCLFMLKLFTS